MVSTLPLKYPVIRPMMTPRVAAIETAKRLIIKETRDP